MFVYVCIKLEIQEMKLKSSLTFKKQALMTVKNTAQRNNKWIQEDVTPM